jgi:hypothetical protein
MKASQRLPIKLERIHIHTMVFIVEIKFHVAPSYQVIEHLIVSADEAIKRPRRAGFCDPSLIEWKTRQKQTVASPKDLWIPDAEGQVLHSAVNECRGAASFGRDRVGRWDRRRNKFAERYGFGAAKPTQLTSRKRWMIIIGNYKIDLRVIVDMYDYGTIGVTMELS